MAEMRACVVCGQGSTREDWQALTNPVCDHHTDEEIQKALATSNPVEEAASTTPKPPAPSGPSSKGKGKIVPEDKE
jgi:hypothetical protein